MTTTTPALLLCGCRQLEHGPLCPLNPDPEVCDVCDTQYDPEEPAAIANENCPGGHCADEACLCYPCTLKGPTRRE